MFEPDEENDRIIYGLKGTNGVGGEVIQEIIENRPYKDLDDFIDRTSANRTAIISLIKGGAFDQFGEREEIMRQYIWKICNPKKRVTLQNFKMLSEKKLLPPELKFQERLFVFDKALKKNHKVDDMLVLAHDNYYNFYEEFFDIDLLEPFGEKLAINVDIWKKIYTKNMEPAKNYIKAHNEELLKKINDSLFQEMWDKYASKSYSEGEMDSLGMYYHGHELKNVQIESYDIVNFEDLPEEPIVDYTFKRKGIDIPIYKTNRIIGTVIAKDDTHSSFSLLTPLGSVVTVKLNRDYFAKYNRRISEVMPDGTKKVKEVGWFQKGRLLMVNGVKNGINFLAKNYAKDKKKGKHQICLITEVCDNGYIKFTNKRWGEEDDEE